MKIIIPMAGMGKRMRPHTLTVPKPLIPVAGKPMVQHIVEDIVSVCVEKIDEVAFITGRFGEETEKKLINVAEQIGAKGTICYQDTPLGTAHAILCAAESLKGKVIVAFADTLFKADFKLDESKEAVIWVQKIKDPSAFGVVTLAENGAISGFAEKPKTFVSDLAIIGIYYFKSGENLKKELQFLIDNSVVKGGEYQLTDALENMKNKGISLYPGNVAEWLDCGNKDATVQTNSRMLEIKHPENYIAKTVNNVNSVIISPCYIGENVQIINSVIGPHVSVGNGTVIQNSVISKSIIQSNANIVSAIISNSMAGNSSSVEGNPADLNISDYSTLKI
jgi:glucose-1-phosphate thymidylyltransferase